MKSYSDKIASIISKNEFLFFFVTVFIIFISRSGALNLINNEECYITFAKQYMDNDWMPYSFHLNDVAGGRIVFQTIFGTLFKYFDTVTTTVTLRFFFSSCLIFFLYKIYKTTKIDLLIYIPILALAYFPHQFLFGGAWIFGGFESKTLAYIFVLWSLNKLIKKERTHQEYIIAGAVYFHFLIGFWYFFIYLLFSLIEDRKVLFKISFKVLILISPLLFYLFSTYISIENTVFEYNPDWIYTYIRNPHHTVPFESWKNFKSHFLVGFSVVSILIILHFTTKISLFFKEEVHQRIYSLTLLISIVQVLFVLLSYFDKNGTFLKLYPFRMNTILSLLMFILITITIQKIKYKRIIFISIIWIATISYTISKSIKMIKKSGELPLVEVANYLKENTDKKSVFLVIDNFGNSELRRLSERNEFYSRFVPTQKDKIVEWYYRMLESEQIIEASKKEIDISATQRKIDYIICNKKRTDKNLIYSSERYFIYKTSINILNISK